MTESVHWVSPWMDMLKKSRVPSATYRLQFHQGFTFQDAAALLPYLEQLGISDVYASPIFTAAPGSPHGYDICDHATINPELGGEAGLDGLVKALQDRNMGLMLDFVPSLSTPLKNGDKHRVYAGINVLKEELFDKFKLTERMKFIKMPRAKERSNKIPEYKK